MAEIWSPEHKIVLERQLWVAVLKAQRDLGIEVPEGVVEAYEAVVARGEEAVDLDSIAARERITRHDVKARIEEFNALASHEHVAVQAIHAGMTSRDLTENVEQLQVKQSLALLRDRAVATLARLGRLAAEHETTVMAGRSHNVAAQATTLGKRFATAADEMLVSVERVEDLLARYPLRGIKGPMGTAQDMLDLLDGDADKLADLEQRVAQLEAIISGGRITVADAGDTAFVLLCVVFIMLMQLGFAMPECGSVRENNVVTTYAKNFLDVIVASLSAALWAYALAYDEFILSEASPAFALNFSMFVSFQAASSTIGTPASPTISAPCPQPITA